MTHYPVIDLAQMGLEEQSLEQLGTKAKRWFIAKDSKQHLFKIGRPGTGENWAEKIAAELCQLLGLPHAKYDFAVNGDSLGVLSPSFVVKPDLLLHGNVLLHRFRDNNANVYKHRHHTVRRIYASIINSAPPDSSLPLADIKNGADVFAGYLLLDAWIGNQDRHDQNWGIIATPPSAEELQHNSGGVRWPLRLAPTCDHASSLGRELNDEQRKARLVTKDRQYDVPAYIARSHSALFSAPTGNSKALSPIEAFQSFASLAPAAALFWLDRLLSLDSNDVIKVFTRIPSSCMSEQAKEFALKMLSVNKVALEQLRARLRGRFNE